MLNNASINIMPQNYNQQNKNLSFCSNTHKSEPLPDYGISILPLQKTPIEIIKANYFLPKHISKLSFAGKFNINQLNKLTTKDVILRMNEQLNIITPQQIQEIIDSFKQEDRPLAAKILQRMAQFGNMESLNKIAEYIKSKNGDIVNYSGICSLNRIMSYLRFNKKAFHGINGQFGLKQFYIIDQITLEELENSKSFINLFKNTPEMTILYPEGWINGINPFSQTDDIRTKVRKILPKVKQIQSEFNLGLNDSISRALNEEVLNKIKILGLKHKFKIIKNESVLDSLPTAENISGQLKPASMTINQLDYIYKRLIAREKQVTLRYLLNCSDIYSPRRLSICLKKMHEKFQRKGMIDKDTYFYVPDSERSYGMIAMMYKLANNIPSSRFICDNKLIPNDAKRLIILDDLAGSGNSLKDRGNILRERYEYKENITFAPVITTFNAIKQLVPKDILRKTICPYKIKENLRDNKFYKSLNEDERFALNEVLGDFGYLDNGLSVVFPYMAPDNNNNFFSVDIAGKFTLNGRGVKY